MAKTEFGQDLSSASANAVYLLKTEDDTVIGVLSLENGADINKHVSDLQEYLYTITDVIGLVGEADPNAKVYTTQNVISNGDNYKVCIEKFDVQVQTNIDNIANNATNIATNVADIADILASVGAANGIAPLDGDSKLPLVNLPNGVFIYKGIWDASTNTPTLIDGTGVSGEVYRVNVAGTQDLGSGSQTFAIGDKVVYNGTEWQKWDTTDEVTSVFGRTGEVVAQPGDYTASDVGLGNVTNDAQLKRSAADFNTFTEKVSPVAADILLIEDSEDTLNKKKILISNLPSSGGSTSTVTKTASTTLLVSGEENVLVDSTAADFTLTLPTAVGNNGVTYSIKKVSETNKVTIDTSLTETIDGESSLTLVTLGDYLEVTSDGLNWNLLKDGISYAVRYSTDSGQLIPNNVTTTIIFEDLERDSHNLYNTSNGVFTSNKFQKLLVNVTTFLAGLTNSAGVRGVILININSGQKIVNLDIQPASSYLNAPMQGSTVIKLNKDDVFEIQVNHNDIVSRPISGAGDNNHMSVTSL